MGTCFIGIAISPFYYSIAKLLDFIIITKPHTDLLQKSFVNPHLGFQLRNIFLIFRSDDIRYPHRIHRHLDQLVSDYCNDYGDLTRYEKNRHSVRISDLTIVLVVSPAQYVWFSWRQSGMFVDGAADEACEP